MAFQNTYASLGPFRGLPERQLRTVVVAANLAFASARLAAYKAVETVDGEQEGRYVKPGLAGVAAAVFGVLEAVPERTRRIRLTLWAQAYAWAVPFVLAALIAWFTDLFGDFAFALMVPVTAVAVIGVCLTLCVSGKNTLLEDVELNGYFGTSVPDAVRDTAGRCWMLGTTVLVTAAYHGDERTSRRTVHYDAIGDVTVTEDGKGLETIRVWSRDGAEVATLAAPTGEFFDTPAALALEIRERAAAARRPSVDLAKQDAASA